MKGKDFKIRGRAGLECVEMFAKNSYSLPTTTYTVGFFGVERNIMPEICLF